MARFLVHLTDGQRVPIDADGPDAARKRALDEHPGASVTKVKLDRETRHPATSAGRVRGRLVHQNRS